MFLPFGDPLYRLLGILSTPHNRLFLALGIVNLMLLVVAVCLPAKTYTNLRSLWSRPACLMGVGAALGLALVLRAIHRDYSLPISVGRYELLACAAACAVIVALLCHHLKALRYLGLVGAIMYSLLAALPVNPLYKGLGSLTNSSVVNAVNTAHQTDPQSAWIVSNKLPLESLPTIVGAQNYSGVYPYPQLSIWQQYFPHNQTVYNRFAHVTFNINDSLITRSIHLVQGDTFSINESDCDPMLKNLNINYILTTDNLSPQNNCFNLTKTVALPAGKINIYQRAQ
jgi:hypothetical protein